MIRPPRSRAPVLLVGTLFFGVLACFEDPAGPAPLGGCPGADYPPWSSSPYVLPYPVGETFRTDLSHCGGSYHSEGLPDEFAMDFNMSIGTVITASRSGTVVLVEESGVDYGFPNNLVVVDHGDGTYAEYMHLTEDGALVDEGAVVAPGDTIGLSGATGLAGYPHLHMVVVEGDPSWPYESIPITFSNTSANPTGLLGNTAYEALPY